jgi:hypothetical protein
LLKFWQKRKKKSDSGFSWFYLLPTRSIEDENSHSVFWREICKWFLSSDFIFAILFEHQFNNLIEFSEIIFRSEFFGKLVETWKFLECEFGY